VRLVAGNAPPREGFESVFMRKDGTRFPVLIIEAPLINAHGLQTGWMSAVLDISEQRRVEELSRASQERLQATARLATVGEMASLLSHELNQPLAAIASYATGSINLLRESPMHAAADLQVAMGRIAEQAERAGRVIKSVHDFVRRRDQAREAVPPHDLFDAILPLVNLQARKLGVRVESRIAEPLPLVLCDRTMVEQVLLNLARNAMQAMDEARGAALAAAAGACRRRLRDRQALAGVLGGGRRARHCGGREGAAVHAFLHHQGRGHGPGPEPVPHRGGAARRLPGVRTEPAARYDLPVHPARPSRLMQPATDATVFIVDDDAGVREALAWLLRSRRLLSAAYGSAEEFEAMLGADFRPSQACCLLLDVRMPGMSGLALFDQLVERGLVQCMPVIFLTGHADVPTAVDMVKRGAFDFCEKPFSDNALVDRIEEACASRRSAGGAARARASCRRGWPT
jgi:FixJ family two-component response regulator